MTNFERLIKNREYLAWVLSTNQEFMDEFISDWWCDKENGHCPLRNECGDDCICWEKYSNEDPILMWFDEECQTEYREGSA